MTQRINMAVPREVRLIVIPVRGITKQIYYGMRLNRSSESGDSQTVSATGEDGSANVVVRFDQS